MKKKFLILLVVFVCILGCLVVMANIDSTDGMHTSLLSEVFDKVTPFSVGKVVEDVVDNNQEIVKSYGDISVTKGELEFAKLILVNNKYEDTSMDAVLDLALKRKLLIKDAKERGLELDESQLKEALAVVRENLGVTEDGKVTKNDEVKAILEENDLSYSIYEKFAEQNLRYTLIYYDYAKLIYNELKETRNDLVFSDNIDDIVDEYLNTLLAELKTNS